MGNWHCLTGSCAKVIYQEYLPSILRYRYLDEDWNEIDGNDYTIDSEIGKCPEKYHCYGTYLDKNAANCNKLGYWKNRVELIGTNVESYQPIVEISTALWRIPLFEDNPGYIRPISESLYNSRTKSLGSIPMQYWTGGCINNTAFSGGNYVQLTDVLREDGNPDNCGDCTFKVFKAGELILELITDAERGCPEVELLPCRLSEAYKSIKIDKIPYLERVEVVPYAYQNLGFGVYKRPIPDECLNIYKNLTTTAIPQFQGFPTPTNSAQALYGLVAQICSAPGCPPPEYTVICDCTCEGCPPETCPVECGQSVCCYDKTTGKSVKEIPLIEYCGS